MAMWMRRLGLVLVNAAVFVVLAELAGLLVYYESTGRLFYTFRTSYPLLEDADRGELTADALHPYFGPIHKPGVRQDTNNIGFGSPRAFPYARTSDREFLLGIFGGSVARQFCDRGVPRLAARLAQQPALAGREVVPLCFAHEGYKQPQQLIVLAYFLSLGQTFDLVLNVDGFNEAALGSANHDRGRDVTMPSPLHLDPLIALVDRSTLTPAIVESLAAIGRYKARLNATARRLQATRSAFVYFVLGSYYRFTNNAYAAELATMAALPPNRPEASLVQVTPPLRDRDGARLYDDIADEWAEASRLMHDMLAARRIPYVHVLQPNQYFTARVFSPAEAAIARSDATPFRTAVERGYPALQEAAVALATHVQFIDATAAFDAERGAVYQDDCCHYNERGNELLADYIASRLPLDQGVAGGPP